MDIDILVNDPNVLIAQVSRVRAPVYTENLSPDVMVMKAAKDRA